MAGRKGRYPSESRERLMELVRAGRSADQLAREFEPSATTIRRWVERADLDQGLLKDGLTTAERKEIRELRRVKLERDILERATARPPLARRCPARESGSIPGGGSGS